MQAPHLLTGQWAERAACLWLQQRGLELLQRNYRCRCGELDLVMLHTECLVFVEVRFRADSTRGGALCSITRSKQKKLQRAARHFIQHHKTHRNRAVRFDALALSGNPKAPQFDWRQRAFTTDT